MIVNVGAIRRSHLCRLWLGVALHLMAGTLQGAVSSSIADRLRAAIRLPSVELQAQFNANQVQDWHGEDDIPDPAGEMERLRKALKGEPADAIILLRVAEVASLTKDRAARDSAGMAALDAAKKWVAAASGDRRAKVQLARAMDFQGDATGAIELLAPLTGSDSHDPGAFHALALASLGLGNATWMGDTNRGLKALAGGLPPSAEQERDASRHYDRALAAAGKAVALEPDEARHLTLRARVRSMRSLLNLCLKPAPDPERRVASMMMASFPQDALSDLQLALKIRPEDPRLITAVIFHECSEQFGSVYFNASGMPEGGALLRKLPEATQERVRAGMARLERLGEGADRRIAAAALENLGIVRVFVSMDMQGMGRLGLRAFRLDPRRGQSFDMALSSQVTLPNPDWAMLEDLVRERMKVNVDERLHLVLAKVQDRRGDLAGATATIAGARKTYSDSTILKVAEFALRLKAGGFTNKEQPGELLEGIGRGLAGMRDGVEKGALHRSLFITLVIANALEGETSVARQRLRQFQAQVPDDDYALEVGRLLRELPATE